MIKTISKCNKDLPSTSQKATLYFFEMYFDVVCPIIISKYMNEKTSNIKSLKIFKQIFLYLKIISHFVLGSQNFLSCRFIFNIFGVFIEISFLFKRKFFFNIVRGWNNKNLDYEWAKSLLRFQKKIIIYF